MKETKYTLNSIVFNIIKGYLKNLFMSWALFWGFFMLFLCLVIIPWFIFQVIDMFNQGFYFWVSNFLYNLSISIIIYPYLQNYQETINRGVSWFLFIILPLVVFITQYVFKKSYEKLEHKFVKKYFIIIAPITFVSLSLSFLLSSLRTDYPWSSSIFSAVFFTIVFSVGSLFAYGFYILSEYLENTKMKDGKLVYEDDWKS